jgi:hypothetical protein
MASANSPINNDRSAIKKHILNFIQELKITFPPIKLGSGTKVNGNAVLLTINALISVIKERRDAVFDYIQGYIDISIDKYNELIQLLDDDSLYQLFTYALEQNLHLLYLATYGDLVNNAQNRMYIGILLNLDESQHLGYHKIYNGPLLLGILTEIMNSEMLGAYSFKPNMTIDIAIYDYIFENKLMEPVIQARHSINTQLMSLVPKGTSFDAIYSGEALSGIDDGIKRTHFDYHGNLIPNIRQVPENKIIVIVTPLNRVAKSIYSKLEKFIIQNIFHKSNIVKFINNYTCYIDSIVTADGIKDCVLYGLQVFYPGQYYFDIGLTVSKKDKDDFSFMGTYTYTHSQNPDIKPSLSYKHNKTYVNTPLSNLINGDYPDIYEKNSNIEVVFVTSCRTFDQGQIENVVIELMYRYNKIHNLINDTICQCAQPVELINTHVSLTTCAYNMGDMYSKIDKSKIKSDAEKLSLMFNKRLSPMRKRHLLKSNSSTLNYNLVFKYYNRVLNALISDISDEKESKLYGDIIQILNETPEYINEILKLMSNIPQPKIISYKKIINLLNHIVVNDEYYAMFLDIAEISNKDTYPLSIIFAIYNLYITNIYNYRSILNSNTIYDAIDTIVYMYNLLLKRITTVQFNLLNIQSNYESIEDKTKIYIYNLYDCIFNIFKLVFNFYKICIDKNYELQANQLNTLYIKLVNIIWENYNPMFVILAIFNLYQENQQIIDNPMFSHILATLKISKPVMSNNVLINLYAKNSNILLILYIKLVRNTKTNVQPVTQKIGKRKAAANNLGNLPANTKKAKASQQSQYKFSMHNILIFTNEKFINSRKDFANIVVDILDNIDKIFVNNSSNINYDSLIQTMLASVENIESPEYQLSEYEPPAINVNIVRKDNLAEEEIDRASTPIYPGDLTPMYSDSSSQTYQGLSPTYSALSQNNSEAATPMPLDEEEREEREEMELN